MKLTKNQNTRAGERYGISKKTRGFHCITMSIFTLVKILFNITFWSP